MLLELNRPIEAVDNFNRLLETDPEHEMALANKGTILCRAKKYDEAIIAFEKLRKINPDHEFLLGQLCLSYMYTCRRTFQIDLY